MFDLLTKMDNTSSMLLEKTLGPRVMFYLVFPSEATYQHVNDVPKYTQLVRTRIYVTNLSHPNTGDTTFPSDDVHRSNHPLRTEQKISASG